MTNKEFEISVRSSRYKASGMRHEIWDLSEGGGDGTDAPVTQTKTKEKKLELRSSIMDRDFDIKMRQVSKWIGKNYFVTVRLIDFTGRGESEAMEKRIKDCLAQSLGPEVAEERLYLLSFKGSGKKATS